MSTRYDVEDEARRLIKNYNDKITRSAKKGQGFPTERMKVSEYSRLSKEEKELFRAHAEAYNKRGSFKVDKASGLSQYQKDYAQGLLDIVNRRRAERRAQVEVSPYKGNLNLVERANLQARELPELKRGKEFNAFMKSVLKESAPDYWSKQDENYRKNYFKKARQVYGKNVAEKLKRRLKNMSGKDMYLASLNNPTLHIDYQYSLDNKADDLLSAWEELTGWNK